MMPRLKEYILGQLFTHLPAVPKPSHVYVYLSIISLDKLFSSQIVAVSEPANKRIAIFSQGFLLSATKALSLTIKMRETG
jgi:hypothetical protein